MEIFRNLNTIKPWLPILIAIFKLSGNTSDFIVLRSIRFSIWFALKSRKTNLQLIAKHFISRKIWFAAISSHSMAVNSLDWFPFSGKLRFCLILIKITSLMYKFSEAGFRHKISLRASRKYELRPWREENEGKSLQNKFKISRKYIISVGSSDWCFSNSLQASSQLIGLDWNNPLECLQR